MKAFIAVIVLALAPLIAHAEPAKCGPYSPEAQGTFRLTTYPESTASWMTDFNAYYITSWWCQGKYAPTSKFYFGYRRRLPASWVQLVQAVPSAKLADLVAAESIYMNRTLTDTENAKGWAQLMATRPPFPVWKVATNGTTTTRPVYPVTNGVRGTTVVPNVRYIVGEPCACWQLAVDETATSAYCPLSASPQPSPATRVTLCKQ